MSLAIHSPIGESVSLSDTPFARGGEAVVYAVPRFPGAVVKLYHTQVLPKRRDSLRAKIDAMVSDPKLSCFKLRAGLAWPKFSVFDEGGHWCGYAKSKADGKRMNVLTHFKAYGEHFPGLDRPALVRYMLSLLGTIVVRHADGLRALGTPARSKGEFANQTCFIDIADIGMVQYGVLHTPSLIGLVLMSHGGAEKLVANDGSQVAARLGEWFDAVADDRFPPDRIALAFHDPAMWERTNLDDRSVIFAARRETHSEWFV